MPGARRQGIEDARHEQERIQSEHKRHVLSQPARHGAEDVGSEGAGLLSRRAERFGKDDAGEKGGDGVRKAEQQAHRVR